jgi:hypothetical protein
MMCFPGKSEKVEEFCGNPAFDQKDIQGWTVTRQTLTQAKNTLYLRTNGGPFAM